MKKEVTGEDVCAREEETCRVRVRKALQKHTEFKEETRQSGKKPERVKNVTVRHKFFLSLQVLP